MPYVVITGVLFFEDVAVGIVVTRILNQYMYWGRLFIIDEFLLIVAD